MGICHLARGVQTYRVNEQTYHLRGGDQLLVLPGETLDTAGTPEEKGHLYWFTLRMKPVDAPLFFLERKAAIELRKTLLALPTRHFTAHSEAEELAATILNTLQPKSARMIDRLAASQAMLRYLFQIIEAINSAKTARPSPRIQRSLDHIAAHLSEPLAVPDLAHLIGLSESRFKNRFRAEIGAPPGDYVLRSKINSACQTLAQTDTTITQLAHSLGFSSSQYFATVFRRFTGDTPTTYKRKQQNSSA
jgi:AraC-like DNA-binding protein